MKDKKNINNQILTAITTICGVFPIFSFINIKY